MNNSELPEKLYIMPSKGICESDASPQVKQELENKRTALKNAKALLKMDPDWKNGYFYVTYTLAVLNRYQEAYETLITAAARFPEDAIILFDLASICCSLNRLDEAREWLAKAIETGGEDIRLLALKDPDLVPILNGIKES